MEKRIDLLISGVNFTDPLCLSYAGYGAAATDTSTSTQQCAIPAPTGTINPDDNSDPGDGGYPLEVDLSQAKKNPLFSQADFDQLVALNHGVFDATQNVWTFCSATNASNFSLSYQFPPLLTSIFKLS
jgi:hypothetical protein